MTTGAITRVLLIEDSAGDARLIREMLNEPEARGTILKHVSSMAAAETYLAINPVDVLLLDLGLPDAHGLEALRRAHAAAPQVPVVVLTGLDDESMAVGALQRGAQDYLIKGQVATPALLRALRYAIERTTLEIALVAEKERARGATAALHVADLLSQKNAADASSAAKNEFLAQMSHEIRTPMNGVLGMTSFLIETNLTPEQREYVETIESSATALLTVINDILNLSTIESGKLVLNPSLFSLRGMMSSAAKVLAVTAAQKSVELIVDIHPDVPDAVVGDALRLRQIILNLGGNAVKFTDRGDVVLTITLESPLDDSTRLRFSVKDTGGGIPSDQIARVFEPFEQLDSSDARSHGGSGLGLTITTRLVALMGGQVWAESVPGIGSTFHFSLTLEVQDNRPVPTDLSGRRVFVIHENESFLAAAGRMLEAHGAEFRGFVSFDEAELCYGEGAGAFDDLIVDDVANCGEGSSIERAMQRGVEPRRIVRLLSAPQLQAGAEECQRLGVTRYLLKPMVEKHLIELLLRKESFVPTHPVVAREDVVTRPLRVLVAEDNLINVRVITRFLERDGHTAVVAANGRKAVEAFQRHAFDVILMDVQMPEVDGLAATREIRELERAIALRTPIIALTANSIDGDRDRCLAAGMDGYVSKPIVAAELRSAIDAVMPVAS